MNAADATVFVVDDDRSVREGLVDMVQSLGMQARAFASAQQFLQHKRPDTPACLVLDVRLPGLSGLDLQRQLGQSGQPIPIVFITAQKDETVRKRALEGGAVGFLLKPFSDTALLKVLNMALGLD